jgi:hypothetical protein
MVEQETATRGLVAHLLRAHEEEVLDGVSHAGHVLFV